MGFGTSGNNAARDAQHPARPAEPLLRPHGQNVAVDAFADLVNRTTAPFRNAPPAHQGTVGQINQVLGGVLGAINAPVELLNSGFALAVDQVVPRALMPMYPAATLSAIHIGIPHPHLHPPSFVPPAPPVPLPSIGPVLLSGCVSVLIGGLPAARAGDMGVAITCGSLAPPFTIFTGSSKVFIGGARAARMLDITKHCQPSPPAPSPASIQAVGRLREFGAAAQRVGGIAMTGAGMAASALGAVAGGRDAEHADQEANRRRGDMNAILAHAVAIAAEAPDVAADVMMSAQEDGSDAIAQAATALGEGLGAGMTVAQGVADAAALALSMLMGMDPSPIPCFGAILEGKPTVLIGGFSMPGLGEAASGVKKIVKGLRRGRRAARSQGRHFCFGCM